MQRDGRSLVRTDSIWPSIVALTLLLLASGCEVGSEASVPPRPCLQPFPPPPDTSHLTCGPQNSAQPGLLFFTDYDALGVGSSAKPVWQEEQEPKNPGANGTLQSDRISILPASTARGSGPAAPNGNAMRVELRPFESEPGKEDGDVTDTGGYKANRSEVYARHAVPITTEPAQWPDPEGSVRWYSFSILVPSDGFTYADDAKWLVLTQWKGRYGGSPPIAIEIERDHLRLGGSRGNSGSFANDGDLGPMMPGTWTRLVVGMRYSPDPNQGWIEVWRDGKNSIPRTTISTMDYRPDKLTGDPVYIKQGIYRSTDWKTPATLWFGPLRIGATRQAVHP